MPENEALRIYDVLDSLRILPRYLNAVSKDIAFIATNNPVIKIEETIAKIDKPTTPQPPPPSKRHLEQWRQFKQGNIDAIDIIALKYLCWQSEVIEDPIFSSYLKENVEKLSARAIKGLLTTIHQNWHPDSPEKEIVKYTAAQLSTFSGRDRAIAKWKSGISMLLGKNGAAYFARDVLLASLLPPKIASEQWALSENSNYMRYAAFNAYHQSKELIGKQKDTTNYVLNVLFNWEIWKVNASGFRSMVAGLILHPNVQSFSVMLMERIWNHQLLGDPRQRVNKNNWLNVDPKAKARFIAWLSKEDIRFFFDTVLKGHDPHGRRDFWLRYVDNMVASRPLLSELTAFSIRSDKNVNYGRLSAGTNRAAFILHFGGLVTVEFSDIGKVYIYRRSEFEQRIPDMWTDRPIREERLKDQGLPEDCKIRHVNWEEKVISILAREGIRP